jgi:hypothetical protein
MRGCWIQDEFMVTEISPEEMNELLSTPPPVLADGSVVPFWWLGR